MPYDDSPPLLPPDQMPAIRSADDLLHTWRAILGPLGFTRRSLWLLFLTDAGRPAGPLLTIDDLPDGPHDVAPDDLVAICDEILGGPGDGRSVALLVTRSGTDPWHVGDRAWARFLAAVAARARGRTWPVHRANDAVVEPVDRGEPLTPS